MADVRELVILRPDTLHAKPETPFKRGVADLKMALRRLIVRSARIKFFRWVYLRIYNAHLSAAAQLGKRISGTRAVYLTSGLATEEILVGVSDVDIAIFGDWSEDRQLTLMKVFFVLTRTLPLFDRNSASNVATVADLKPLSASNMLIALVHARGQQQWKLLHGTPVLTILPEISADRFAGCVYMELRRWWSTLSRMAFGSGITARDPIFRNSISFKAAAETLRAESMLLRNQMDNTPRSTLIEQELDRHDDPLLRMLSKSASNHYLDIDSDPREPILRWFLGHVEHLHQHISHKPPFALAAPVKVKGSAGERMITAQTQIHTQHLVELAATEWPGLRSAFLVPCVAMASPDHLALILEAQENSIPAIEQLQRLLAEHHAETLPQRVSLHLLLGQAAYQLETKSPLEFFHCTLLPEANPDVFLALSQPEYVLYGQPRKPPERLGWSPFAQELAMEELSIRRGAYLRFGLISRPRPVENLRNLWRFLQLRVIEHSRDEGAVELPTTMSAIRVTLAEWHPGSDSDLRALEHHHPFAMEQDDQTSTAIHALMQRIYKTFNQRNEIPPSP